MLLAQRSYVRAQMSDISIDIYIYKFILVLTHTLENTCIHSHIRTLIGLYPYTYIHTYTHTRICVCVCVCVCVCGCVCVGVCVHSYMYVNFQDIFINAFLHIAVTCLGNIQLSLTIYWIVLLNAFILHTLYVLHTLITLYHTFYTEVSCL